MVYGPGHLANSIYMVVAGTVAVSQIAEGGTEVLLEVILPEELFGEKAFLDGPRRFERAVAIEKAKVMAWAITDLEALVTKRPPLAVALLQVMAQRNAEFTRRIGSLATDNIQQRLARSLLRLSERLGTPEDDGSVRMMPFTHEMLSRYVGTSREIITQYMNQFRKQGFVSYSRQGINLYREPLRTVLAAPSAGNDSWARTMSA